jgi:hypothetical protein
MVNALSEYISHIGSKKVIAAYLEYSPLYLESPKVIPLKVNYSQIDYKDFLWELDFNYDNGFGWHCLDGHIWYADGTWSERKEYDGSEWWEYKSIPEMPESCI